MGPNKPLLIEFLLWNNNMIDIKGTELKIGDKVAVAIGKYATLFLGVVDSFTPSRIQHFLVFFVFSADRSPDGR